MPPATGREWSDAFLEQAREDLRAAEVLGPKVPSVFAMLLQMTFEKFAKAALLRQRAMGVATVTKRHGVCTKFMPTLGRQRRFLGLPNEKIWHDALYVVLALETAHPSLAAVGPHLEYPWEDASGNILTPAKNLPIVQTLSNPTKRLAANTITFGKALSERFDAIFG